MEQIDLPHAFDLEEVVLGAAMLEKEGLDDMLGVITEPKVFYNGVNRMIFEAIVSLHKKEVVVDIMTVTNELRMAKNLDTVGGPYHISQLTNRVSSAANIQYHCRILEQYYMKRELIHLGDRIRAEGSNMFHDVFDSIDDAHATIRKLEGKLASEKVADNNALIDEIIKDINSASDKGGIVGYSTGIKALDHALMGLRHGLKYVIAGRPGMGKTSLAKSICINLAHIQNIPGCFFSMEMTAKQLMNSCISEILELPNEDMQKGKLSKIDKDRILQLKNTLFTTNFIIDDQGGLDPGEIDRKVAKLKQSHKIEWIAIDYIGLMELKNEKTRGRTREQEISEVTSRIKNTAKKFNLIVFELSQLSREVEKRSDNRPKLSDLKDSGAVEANADVVIFPHRPEYYGQKELWKDGPPSAGFAELIIAKNRFGKPKSVAAAFNESITAFSSTERVMEVVHVPETDQEFF